MKPFNLEEYLANPSKKLVTKGGINVRIICTDRLSEYPVVALLYCEENEGDSHEQIITYTRKGQFNMDFENSLDLFFAPEKKVGWVNIYRGCYGTITSANVFSSKEEAEEASMHCNGFTQGLHLVTVKIEWEE